MQPQENEHNTENEQINWRPQDADREARKWNTRQRVRNATVPEGTVFKPARPKPSIGDPGEKTVAVYARVSTSSEEQVSSIENQTRYYTDKIAKTPNWTMQQIYADEGKSGTSMKKRAAFRQMIEDAKDKKMDIILCASVSRFARNMTDCMDQISALKTTNPNHPVGVYFETENIFTLDPDSDQALSIHAMLADWESANKSRRMTLSYDQRIELGMFPLSDLLGYRHTQDGKLIIEEEEAKTVRFIFLARVFGYSFEEIANILTDKERSTLRGRTEWNEEMVRNVLTNERRWGDLEARKTIVLDYKKGKVVKNNGMRDAAFVPNHHEGIVTKEIAMAAQAVNTNKNVKGVPDIKLIKSGALKGFVCVNPCFSGIDRAALFELSKSAYEDEEYNEVVHEANILNGNETSKITSFEFGGYFVPYSAHLISNSTPTLTISKNQIKLNRRCVEFFSDIEKIEFLYHPILQAIVIRNCEDESGIEISKEVGNQNYSTHAFSMAIYEELDWIKELSFKFKGVKRIRGSKKALVFFLDEPQIVSSKVTKQMAQEIGANQNNLPSVYIPYKNSELSISNEELVEKRKQKSGRMYSIRKRKDKVFDGVTEADLKESGVIVENPFIGSIPSKEEVMAELENLLMSM